MISQIVVQTITSSVAAASLASTMALGTPKDIQPTVPDYTSISPVQYTTIHPRQPIAPAARPPVVPTPPVDVHQAIQTHAAAYGVSPELMTAIAQCESGFNPAATNGPYGGMFQFSASTWTSNRNAMGEDPNPDLRFDANEAARTAAFKIARDGTGAWPVCQHNQIG